MLLAMGSANLRVLRSLEQGSGQAPSFWNPRPQNVSNSGPRLEVAQRQRIWRARNGPVTTEDFNKCMEFLPRGVECLGLTMRQTREVWRPDASPGDLPEVTLLALTGIPLEIVTPIISPGLVQHAKYLKDQPVATFHDPNLVGARQEDRFLVIDHEDSGFTGYGTLQATVSEEISPELATRLLDAVEKTFRGDLIRVDPESELETRKNMTASYRLNLSILGLMSVLVSGLLLRNTAALQMILRRPLVAVLRQTGASRNTIIRLVLAEQILVALTGCVAGVIGGIFLEQAVSYQVLKTVRSLYTPDVGSGEGFALKNLLWPVLSAAGAGILVYLASSFAMLRGLVQTEPRNLAAREFEGRERQTDIRRVRRAWLVRLSGAVFSCVILAAAPFIRPIVIPGTANLQVPLYGYIAAFAVIIIAFSVAGATSLITTRLLLLVVPAKRAHLMPALAISVRRNLQARRRPEAAVATLATGLALVTGISLMVDGFRESFTAWLDRSFTAEVVALPVETRSNETRPRLSGRDHDVLRKVMNVQSDCVLLEDGSVRVAALHTISAPVKLAAIDDSMPEGYPLPLEAISWPGSNDLNTAAILQRVLLSDDRFLVSEALARKMSLRVGDRVEVSSKSLVAGKESSPISGIIAGVVRDYSSELGYVFIGKPAWERKTGMDGCHSLRIYTRGEATSAFSSRLLQKLPDVASKLNVQSSASLKKMATGTFEQTFKVSGLLTILAAILGGIALIVQIAQSAADRRYEWLALRRLGASWGRMTLLLAADVGISVLAGLILGLFCGGIIGWLLIVVINRQAFGWSIAIPGPSALASTITLALIYAATLWLAGVAMSWWTMRPGKSWEVTRE
jgi:putative ABC transport system permease protein